MARKVSQKSRKVKNPVWGKMVQGNIKVTKESMKKSKSWKAQTSANKRKKKNNLTRIERRNPVLSRHLSHGKTLILDQSLICQLLQLLLHGGRNRPGRRRSPHGEKLLVLDHLKNLIFIHLSHLLATRYT
jgi:hypothetical protein